MAGHANLRPMLAQRPRVPAISCGAGNSRLHSPGKAAWKRDAFTANNAAVQPDALPRCWKVRPNGNSPPRSSPGPSWLLPVQCTAASARTVHRPPEQGKNNSIKAHTTHRSRKVGEARHPAGVP
ncbi:uncharacterized protein Tco025E_04865 [Trypanosoma conorhini]|uniref:Uncharacterized protein n=1 Tax=Trypanosoma conorhini TaxID=83891 RepID=A0A3R7L185_9TRYP|nr:uncharacterized protein Tco025E_04865 [Trypanosoma conorhini]RNF17633.1 hypothetical protein Tco025E_04865 [Trypanosoma conorhini]